eukprot:TRINITY_DN2932_c0_g1_i1.p1 TRINITY_DN2932_c0_g1~~TRINITY_DN2932_c0_g1_i1.p1  ORF type:complete len:374 (+),score=85.64 TRINITY_DN2932_c0_g1_i1:164-1285(+)
MSIIGNLLFVVSAYYFLQFVLVAFELPRLLLDNTLALLPVLPTAYDFGVDVYETVADYVAVVLTFSGFLTFLGYLTLFSLICYIVPIFIVFLLPEQDLKKKYDAEWAFVTGGSSGLGRQYVEKCASQGLNVVICALDDDLLHNTYDELTADYPDLEFRKVGANLGATDPDVYMKPIKEATEDIPVQVVFSNAGFLILRAYAKTDINFLMTNFNCNVTSHLQLAHYFFKRMMVDQLKGCICFTSSQASILPVPANVLYGAGKACITAFAGNLALEGISYGIDVSVIQAGPMATRFSDNVSQIDCLKGFNLFASTPQQVASVMFRSVGRLNIRDHSLITIGTRIAMKFIDVNLFSWIVATAQPHLADWKNFPDLH